MKEQTIEEMLLEQAIEIFTRYMIENDAKTISLLIAQDDTRANTGEMIISLQPKNEVQEIVKGYAYSTDDDDNYHLRKVEIIWV